MTLHGWKFGCVIACLSVGFLACEPQENTTEETEMAGGTMQPGIPTATEEGFGPAQQETESIGEVIQNEEETPIETEPAQASTVEFRVEYNGEVQGDLLMTLFAEWPPSTPPSFFSLVSDAAFPSNVALEDVTPGTWTAVAVLDAAPKNPASQGPEDRMGLIEIEVPASGVITVVISDEPPVMPEETSPETTPEEVETPAPVATSSSLRFDRLTIDANANGPAFGTVVDVDDDGVMEVVVASFGVVQGLSLPNGEVNIYKQGATLEDWTKTSLFTPAEGIVWPNDIHFEDVDGDGDSDALVPYGFLVCGAIPLTGPCGGIAWFEQTGNGWNRHDVIPYGDNLFYHVALLHDLNGDGYKDLITVGEERTAGFGGVSEKAQVRWFAGNASNDRFEKTPREIGAGLGSLPQLYDVDQDGDMDIVSAEFFAALGASYSWYEQLSAPVGQGSGEWKRHVIDSSNGPSIQLSMVENFFGDGDVIALGANHTNNNAAEPDPEPSSFVYFRIPADPKTPWDMTTITTIFSSIPGSSTSPSAAPGIFGVGDADNDGDQDVIISGDGDPRTFLLEQLPGEEFVVHVLDENMGQAGGMVIADVNQDGSSELLTSSYDESGVYLYVQSETGDYPIGVAEAPQSWWDEFGPEEEIPSEEVEVESDGSPWGPGPFAVNTSTTTLAGSNTPVDIYLPTGAPAPSRVALHHGFMLSKGYYTQMAQHLASHGFAVFAPQTHEPGGLPFGKPTVGEEMATVEAFYDWLDGAEANNTYGPFATTPVGVIGHSRGGKVAWLSAQSRPDVIGGVVAIDPVDSAGAVTDGDVMALDSFLPSSVSSLSLGMGLAGVSSGLFSPACAPEDSNYTHFFDNAAQDAWRIELVDGGHLDVLDDNPADCGLVCTQCTAGNNPALNRETICGLAVAFLKSVMDNDESSTELLSDSAQHPVSTAVLSK